MFSASKEKKKKVIFLKGKKLKVLENNSQGTYLERRIPCVAPPLWSTLPLLAAQRPPRSALWSRDGPTSLSLEEAKLI